MAESITSIKPQKRNKNRFSIYIDHTYRFSVSEALACRLRIGQQLSGSEIADLESADQYEQAFSRALHYLKFRPRSSAELSFYLEKKGYTAKVIDSAMKRLEHYGYIDDIAFVQFWIENRERHRPRGEFGLRHELKAKGICEKIIDAHLTGYDESGPAWRAVAPKLNRWQQADAFELKKKIHAFLGRRGFTYSTCEAVWERATGRGNAE